MTAAAVSSVFVVRPEASGERGFVLSAWARTSREVYERNEGLNWRAYQDRMMIEILQRPSTSVRVISVNGDDALAGCVVLADGLHGPMPAIVYHLFVRKEARRMGLARLLLGRLIDADGVGFTERTPVGIIPPRRWRFVPRANFFDMTQGA
jgi:GNAT superfamily N-acetyltransferase